MTEEPQDYALQRLRDALATDERVGEMGVDVHLTGAKVFLTGQVATPERQQAVATVAAEVLPDYEVHNQTSVTPIGDPPRVEKIT